MLIKYLIVFLISMVPIIELRGAIPIAIDAYHLNVIASFAVAIIGNMLPVPFIYLFARKILEWGKDKKGIGKICQFFLVKGKKGGNKILKSAKNGTFVGLMLFVGIPLPGTGAWTGTLAASILDLDFKKTILAVLCGVLMAGIIMLILALGFGIII